SPSAPAPFLTATTCPQPPLPSRSESTWLRTTRSSRTRCRRSSHRSPWPRPRGPSAARPTAPPPSSRSTGSAPRSSAIRPVLAQHVPKTNGDIPSFDEAFSDHRRLLDRLVLYVLVELKGNGDGNCQ
ncbi:hypothetical protein CFC21_102421, partial [Triticum aestivum]